MLDQLREHPPKDPTSRVPLQGGVARQLWLVDEFAFANGWLGSTARHFALARAASAGGWQVSLLTPRRRCGGVFEEVAAAFPGRVIMTPFTSGPCPPLFDRRFLARAWVWGNRVLGRRERLEDPDLQWALKLSRWFGERSQALGRPDVVWAVSYGGLNALAAGRCLAGASGAGLVVAIHDPIPWPGHSLGLFERRAFVRALEEASAVIVTTATYAEVLAGQFPQAAGKIEVIYATYSAMDAPASPPSGLSAVASTSGSGALVELLLAGSIYKGQENALQALIRGLALLAQEHPEVRGGLRLRVMGGGPRVALVDELASLEGVSDMVVLAPQLSPVALRDQLSCADSLVVLGWDDAAQVPGKLFRYLAARKPILGVFPEGEAAQILRRTGLGIVVPPQDPQAVAQALGRLWASRGSLADFLTPDEQYLLEFSEDRMAERLVRILNQAGSR